MAAILSGAARAALGMCGPFTDVSDAGFCPFILEIFYLGITTGTTPTTYDPSSSVNRLQMAAFLSRSVDGVLKRGSRRAAMNQFWTPQGGNVIGMTTVGFVPLSVQSDGEDLWVASPSGSGLISRIHGSDGRILDTWTANGASAVLVAMERVFVSSINSPAQLYRIDPSQPAGIVTTVATNLGNDALGIAFDGARVWTAGAGGSISIATPGVVLPWTVTTVTTGFTTPEGILYDGANVWVSDAGAGTLLKLNPSGAVLQTVTLGPSPGFPVFDGTNIWVPVKGSASVSVVRATSGTILTTLTGNGLGMPAAAAFDGQRVLVTNPTSNNVSLWKAADLTPLGSIGTGLNSNPFGACSDGINFWITLSFQTGPIGQLAKF
jgi:hypothetical protein